MSTSTLQGLHTTLSLPPYVGAVIFESFLYGLYVILFAICTFVLISRHKRLHWILLLSATTMFALATSDIIYTCCILFEKLMKRSPVPTDVRPKYWLYVTNNVIADSLLLYRCWVVWEYRKMVMLGPMILLIAGTACGYTFEASTTGLADDIWIYLIMTLILNATLTTLTAGRIWYLAKKARLVLGMGLLRRYNATITILIESGILYSLYIILDLGFRKQKTMSVILDAGLIQIVGVVPTLIIVKVGLGRAVHDVEANEAITRLEGNKASPTRRSFPDDLHCVHSREGRHASNFTFISGRHVGQVGSELIIGQTREIDHEIAVESLRHLRGESLRLSWEFGMASSPPGLGILQQVPKTI
ncbi:hypothetical protein BDN70DRAFT_883304 [Pholiota conissans]|uniref:Uncharacterized protein n=1 Tax=Pholiota conissans TaxID=109636 RepID=A0A9P5YUL6_9AGAR|nr:hypothetical protein BDN70DRAFT_883304 [Pholiota conissans]